MYKYETKDIITEFIETKLEQRGHFDWVQYKLHNKEKNNKRKNVQKKEYINDIPGLEFDEIIRTLDKISDALLEFIRKNRSQTDLFTKMTDQLIDNFEYKNFETLSDEIFAEGITWSHIVTLLVFSLECATKTIEKDPYYYDEDYYVDQRQRGELTYQLIDWMVKYFHDKIEDWISTQESGWLAMKVLESPDSNKRDSNYRQYFGVATIAVLISTLYFCSRF